MMNIGEVLAKLTENKIKSIELRKEIEARNEVIAFLEEIDAQEEIKEQEQKLRDLECYHDIVKESIVRLNRELFRFSSRNERTLHLQCV